MPVQALLPVLAIALVAVFYFAMSVQSVLQLHGRGRPGLQRTYISLAVMFAVIAAVMLLGGALQLG